MKKSNGFPKFKPFGTGSVARFEVGVAVGVVAELVETGSVARIEASASWLINRACCNSKAFALLSF